MGSNINSTLGNRYILSENVDFQVKDIVSLKVQIASLHGIISDLRIQLTQQAHSERMRGSDLIHINADLNQEIRRLRDTNDKINQERLKNLEKTYKFENLTLEIECKIEEWKKNMKMKKNKKSVIKERGR